MKKSINALVYVRRVLGDRLSAISSWIKSRWAISLRDKGDAAMVESRAKVNYRSLTTELTIILLDLDVASSHSAIVTSLFRYLGDFAC
jgi:hypothetical protein